MQDVHVKVTMLASPEKIWPFIADIEGYRLFPYCQQAELLKKSPDPANIYGIGAVRRLVVMGTTFDEEIVGFEPNKQLDYSVRRCTIPLNHLYGKVVLTPQSPEQTLVEWKTRFDVDIPFLHYILGPIGKMSADFVFEQMLLYIKSRVENVKQVA